MDKWEKRYIRERQARSEAEQLLENKSRELFKLNQSLEQINKSLEATVKERTHKYKEARNEAIEATHKKSEFIANISHDLRSPLHAIIGIAEKISESISEKGIVNDMYLLLEACYIQLGLLNKVLDLSKIEQGSFELDIQSFNLHKAMQTIYDMHKILIPSSEIEFSLIIDDEVPEYVVGDVNRLKQILSNLIGNAIKHTQQGYIKFTINQIKTSESCDIIKFSIKDSGKGIEENKKKVIFKRYQQLPNEKIEEFGGLGLGLSICSELVQLMKGNLDFSSTFCSGSKFWVEIPFEKVKVKQHKQKSMLPDSDLSNFSILCVDDEKTNIFLMKQRLSKLGCRVVCASCGSEALELIKKTGFDLIFLDMQMPNMNGYEFLEKATELSLLEHSTIIAMTANIMRLKKDELKKFGVNRYLFKPFNKQSLEDTLLMIKLDKDG